ncbi:MAG: aconitase family protein, partial [Bacilli bacterium]
VKIIGTNKNISAKDVILYILKENGVSFAQGYALEFFGDYITQASMDERMSICNMAIEGGAKYGLCAFDQTTYDYMVNAKASNLAPYDSYTYLKTDKLSDYDKIIEVDITNIKPVITWGVNPSLSVFVGEDIPDIKTFDNSYEYMGVTPGTNISNIPITQVFIGSCTNGRLSDLVLAAKLLQGKKVKDGVRVLVVPGSQAIMNELIALGYDKVFIDAGASFRNPGCSSCLAMNNDIMPAYEHVASTSNRNFEGRQGNLARTHLCSVEMACSAALNGYFKEVY